jgi:hypothetical protein
LGIVIFIINSYLETKYHERRKANNSTGTRTMYAHEEDLITDEKKERLEIMFKIVKILIIISIAAFALYGIVGLALQFNLMWTHVLNNIK